MASVLAKPSAPQRQSTKPVPAQAPTVGAFVQRAATISNRTGIRPAGSTMRSRSPVAKITNVNSSTRPLSPEASHRPAASHSRSNSLGGISEGMGNLNRWSQSTVSSKSSVNTHKRRNSFARRLSGSFGSLAPFGNQQSPTSSKGFLKKSQSSPTGSPQKAPQNTGATRQSTRFASAVTLSTLSHAVQSANTPSTGPLTTPATADLLAPGSGDYFGDKWTNRSPPRQRNDGNKTPVISSSASSPSRHRRPEGPKPSHAPAESVVNPSWDHRESSNAQYKPRSQPSKAGHSKPHEHAHKSSGGTEGESSTSSIPSQDDRRRRRKAPSQKTMLSKALQKANHAVLLDHAANFEGAVAAYDDACDLLQQVMIRSSGEDDRRKLEAIRNTYMNRVAELQTSELELFHVNDKALPDVPMRHSNSIRSQDPFSPITESEDEDSAVLQSTTAAQEDDSRFSTRRLSPELQREQHPPRRQSLMPSSLEDDGGLTPTANMQEHFTPLDPWSIENPHGTIPETNLLSLATPMEKEYMPPPLSPRRPISPSLLEQDDPAIFRSAKLPAPGTTRSQHMRQETAESTSWLDTIDESGASSASSIHSRSSSVGLRRKRIRAPSGATEAEFDAALDAAVEAAYDDGFEPDAESLFDPPHEVHSLLRDPENVSDISRNTEVAKDRTRETEDKIAVSVAQEQEMNRRIERSISTNSSEAMDADYDDDEAEEEERLLEEMTQGYILDDTEYEMQTKSALPRQSDSSGFSGRTWGSSIGSIPNTARTTLSTVTEASPLPELPTQILSKAPPPPLHPPPSGALPPAPRALVGSEPTPRPPVAALTPPVLAISRSPSVRERRLSVLRAKQLKIDTGVKLPPGMTAPRTQPSLILPSEMFDSGVTEPPKSASLVADSQESASNMMLKPLGLNAGTRQVNASFPGPSPVESASAVSSATSASSRTVLNGSDSQTMPVPNSPSRISNRTITGPGTLRKNFSSSSLRSIKQSLTASSSFDDLPSTPLSRAFSSGSQAYTGPVPAVPDLPHPATTKLGASRLPFGGIHFFDSDIHSPHEPGTPSLSTINAPLPLEPCPESFLLRPFWVMRCIYHTMVNPRGGYISTRLFVPRDIWRVKNVKLKNVDDKVSSCDLLTAALLKLIKVDTLDADAVLEEMQSFELVLDQVQAVLAKRLGGDVGIHSSIAMFKGSPTIDENETLASRSTNTSSKSYLSTWRKLRSKNSSGPGIPTTTNSIARKDGTRETLTMRSLPMTSSSNARFVRRETGRIQGIGPHAHYMAALARLCDAAQVLDQIARQVEDPGLKHISQTHVGLELSTRHAAEFFGFYICRFVLADIGMMLDKFVKRGSEWVLV
ncbi:hypothetical protein MMC26_005002 [Xylographa opegraphella]|nr:hypothetical protein [Xylographa opegraphella]